MHENICTVGTPWQWRKVVVNERTTALLLETTAKSVPLNDPVVFALREDWIGKLSAERERAKEWMANAPVMLALLDDLCSYAESATLESDPLPNCVVQAQILLRRLVPSESKAADVKSADEVQRPELHSRGPIHMGQWNGEGSIFMTNEGRMRMESGGTTLYPIAHVGRGWNAQEDEANERRLVACWNAFEGVPTAKVEMVSSSVMAGALACRETFSPVQRKVMYRVKELVHRVDVAGDAVPSKDTWVDIRESVAAIGTLGALPSLPT